MKADYYFVQTPEVSMSFIGQVRPSTSPGMVYLCSPDGQPRFETRAEYVTRSSAKEMAERLIEDRRHAMREAGLWN